MTTGRHLDLRVTCAGRHPYVMSRTGAAEQLETGIRSLRALPLLPAGRSGALRALPRRAIGRRRRALRALPRPLGALHLRTTGGEGAAGDRAVTAAELAAERAQRRGQALKKVGTTTTDVLRAGLAEEEDTSSGTAQTGGWRAGGKIAPDSVVHSERFSGERLSDRFR